MNTIEEIHDLLRKMGYNNTGVDQVCVNSKALNDVLNALIGPPHLIRELQATMNMPAGIGDENPIAVLIGDFNRAMRARKEVKH